MKKITNLFIMFLLGSSVIGQVSKDSMISLAQMSIVDPAGYQRYMTLETFIANYAANQTQSNQRLINFNGVITIPVVVHVLHHGEAVGTGLNISLAQIQSQIDI